MRNSDAGPEQGYLVGQYRPNALSGSLEAPAHGAGLPDRIGERTVWRLDELNAPNFITENTGYLLLQPAGEGHMPEILAENLSGKAVMGSDGAELGMLYNITMNIKTGELQNLVVEPNEETAFDSDFDVDEDGRFHVPIHRVQAVKDYIVVER